MMCTRRPRDAVAEGKAAGQTNRHAAHGLEELLTPLLLLVEAVADLERSWMKRWFSSVFCGSGWRRGTSCTPDGASWVGGHALLIDRVVLDPFGCAELVL
jgi:hypothetical protein